MTKQDVLALLEQAGEPISGEQLCKRLGVTRAAVWKAIEALRSDGYDIEAATRRGYRLRTKPLTKQALDEALKDAGWREKILVLPEVDSTNNYLKTLAANGAPDGTAVLSLQQTAGRGRRGRSFLSESGGLYLSFLLRPNVPASQLLHLTALAGLCVCNAVEQTTGMQAGIKWPNDPVLNGKKLCGILTELSMSLETQEPEYVVVGIGVNCNQAVFPPELDMATSLRIETGECVDVNLVAAALLRELHQMREEFLTKKGAWVQAFSEKCLTVGRDIQILRGGEAVAAKATGIGPDAELLVEYPDGTRGAVDSGEVSVRGLYGYV